jgi:hypothetical protein
MRFFTIQHPVDNIPSATAGFSELSKSWFYDYQKITLALQVKKGMGAR